MMKVTLVLPYYDNARMLQEHVRVWGGYDDDVRENLSVIIVDDCSQEIAAADLLRGEEILRRMNVRVYRVQKDIPWNQDGARNLAMAQCSTEWALMTDMDHVLDRHNAHSLVCQRPVEGYYYMPRQFLTNGDEIGAHPNTFLFSKCDFWHMGGYDEDFAGWYGSDGNFRKCAKGAGLTESPTRAFGLIVYRTSDIADANTRRYGRKDSPYYAASNPELNAKRRGPPYRAERPVRFEWVREL